MLRYSIRLPSTIKFLVISDLALGLSLKNKSSMVSVGSSDVLDTFITNLTNSKTNKWKTKKKAVEDGICNVKVDPTNSGTINSACDITEDSVDEYILKNFTSPSLKSILNICLDKNICPSSDTMIKLAHEFAKSGIKEGIEILMSLSKIGNFDRRRQEEYRIYQAEAMWRSGESTERSLQTLGEVYREQPALRRQVRSSLRPLLAEVILNRGEASLMQAKQLVLQLASPPYEDHIPLSFIWSRCILSECFADQQMAVELVEEGKSNVSLKRAVGSRVDAILGEALLRHQIDAVYRLLEALLKLSMTKHSQVALGKLFDYKYVMGDVAGCEAVLKACDVLDLDVGFTRRKQFEKLQAKRSGGMFSGSKYERKIGDNIRKPVPKFKLKL